MSSGWKTTNLTYVFTLWDICFYLASWYYANGFCVCPYRCCWMLVMLVSTHPDLAPSSHCSILTETVASKASWENGLSIAPMHLINQDITKKEVFFTFCSFLSQFQWQDSNPQSWIISQWFYHWGTISV